MPLMSPPHQPSGTTLTNSPFYTAEHLAYRDVVRRFVEKEIAPYAHEWDEAGSFPRALYEKAAEIGLLGLGFPEEYGGSEVDNFMWIVAVQEPARGGCGGGPAAAASAPASRAIRSARRRSRARACRNSRRVCCRRSCRAGKSRRL